MYAATLLIRFVLINLKTIEERYGGMVIQKLKCNDYNAVYVGQPKRSLPIRLNQHLKRSLKARILT